MASRRSRPRSPSPDVPLSPSLLNRSGDSQAEEEEDEDDEDVQQELQQSQAPSRKKRRVNKQSSKCRWKPDETSVLVNVANHLLEENEPIVSVEQFCADLAVLLKAKQAGWARSAKAIKGFLSRTATNKGSSGTTSRDHFANEIIDIWGKINANMGSPKDGASTLPSQSLSQAGSSPSMSSSPSFPSSNLSSQPAEASTQKRRSPAESAMQELGSSMRDFGNAQVDIASQRSTQLEILRIQQEMARAEQETRLRETQMKIDAENELRRREQEARNKRDEESANMSRMMNHMMMMAMMKMLTGSAELPKPTQ